MSTQMDASYSQPGRLLANAAAIRGVHVSDILTGYAVPARAWTVHRLVDHFPNLPRRRIARLVCLTRVDHILAAEPAPPPPDAARPVDDGSCTVAGCDRRHCPAGLRLCPAHVARWRRDGDLGIDRPLRPINVNTRCSTSTDTTGVPTGQDAAAAHAPTTPYGGSNETGCTPNPARSPTGWLPSRGGHTTHKAQQLIKRGHGTRATHRAFYSWTDDRHPAAGHMQDRD